ncbi:hypothetical protein [Frankia sp. Cas4]|uniref:hypothetical protein n=1 Tax=Frankia sp. Cas4 TaxID=3073927 RepID=UPI002AD4CD48|nr:hypothetical protein [Frankia sp. Cas4]
MASRLPVTVAPAEPAAVLRYALDGAWCAPYALGWRRAGVAYAYLVALPITAAAYSTAWLAQWAGGITGDWLPTETITGWRRWLYAWPPALAEVAADAAAVPGARRVAAWLAVGVSAVAYGTAWIAQRPGRLAAAAGLALVLSIFTVGK